MKVLTIDPGASPGFAVLDTDVPIATSGRAAMPRCQILAMHTNLHALATQRPDLFQGGFVCLVEYQYVGRVSKHEISARSIVRLAFRAGLAAGQALALGATDCYAVIPQTWKSALCRGGGQVLKEIMTNRIRANLFPDELRRLQGFPEKAQTDVLDAIGMGWAFSRLHPTVLTAARVRFDSWLPVYDGVARELQ